MILGLALSLVLIAATILIHYKVLRLTSIGLVELATPVHARILVVLTASIASHYIHIAL